MRIRVYAPSFCDHNVIDDDGFMTVHDGATLKQVLKKLKIPLIFRVVMLVTVNYERVKSSSRLKEGDVVSILGAVSGG